MISRPWTEEHYKILRENYETASKEELMRLLPNRSWNAIKVKGEINGLKRPQSTIRDIVLCLPERLCVLCRNFYKPKSPSQRYCSGCMPSRSEDIKAYNRKLWSLNIERKHTLQKKYRKLEKVKTNKKKSYILERERWGYISRNEHILPVDIELFGMKILEKEGYTDIHHIIEIYPIFPFDLIATSKEGKKVLVDVTSSFAKNNLIRKHELCLLLGIEPYLLFVKPDKTNYWLTPIPPHKNSMRVPPQYRISRITIEEKM